MTEYLTEDQIIQLNKEVLKIIRVKKGDSHKVLSKAVIKRAIDEAKSESGTFTTKQPLY